MNSTVLSIDLGAVAYAISAVVNSIFAVLLMTSWKGRHTGVLLFFAAILSVVWAAALATVFRPNDTLFRIVYVLEVLKGAGWLVFLLSVLGYVQIRRLLGFRFLLPSAVIVIIAINAIIGLQLFLAGSETPLTGELGSLPVLGLLAMGLAGIVLIEQLYRNTPADKRWALKFLCVGLGAMFAYDIYLYANSLMFHRINMLYWDARGVISAAIVPLMAVSIARDPRFSVNLFVSRHIVFYSSAITAVGVYLLVMSVGGYYLREFGGTWGGFIQVIFLFGAALLLVLILLSGKTRAKFKVFFVKHFFSNKYDYRIEWLKLINTLSNTDENETLQRRAIKSLVNMVSARGGCLWWLSDKHHYTLQETLNMDPPPESVERCDSEFSMFLKTKKWVIDITENSPPQGFVMPLWLKALKEKNAWLVVPLIDKDSLFGFIVLEGRGENPRMDWEDMDFLKTVGRQLTSYLALEVAAEEISQSRQFDAYNKLAAFIIHDIRNLVSQLSLVTQNAVVHRNNPLFVQDAMQTVENSVHKMNALLTKLRRNDGNTPNISKFDIGELLKEVIGECSAKLPIPELSVETGIPGFVAERERLSMMMRHLIGNAQDATADNGSILVRVNRQDNFIVIEVKDNGCGMTPEFVRNRLFRPFDTTKSGKGMGIGAYEVREYVQSLNGVIEVKSSPDMGTVISIRLPSDLLAETSYSTAEAGRVDR